MSKTIMWAETDARGVEAECLFNEDSRTFEVLVCAKRPWISRSESFPVGTEPVMGMAEADHFQSMMIAERLVAEIGHSLGDH